MKLHLQRCAQTQSNRWSRFRTQGQKQSASTLMRRRRMPRSASSSGPTSMQTAWTSGTKSASAPILTSRKPGASIQTAISNLQYRGNSLQRFHPSNWISVSHPKTVPTARSWFARMNRLIAPRSGKSFGNRARLRTTTMGLHVMSLKLCLWSNVRQVILVQAEFSPLILNKECQTTIASPTLTSSLPSAKTRSISLLRIARRSKHSTASQHSICLTWLSVT